MLKCDVQSIYDKILHNFLIVVKMEKPKSQKSFACYIEDIILKQFHILVFKSSEIKMNKKYVVM